MEERTDTQQPRQGGYVPRPAWQVWGARAAAAVFAGLIALQIAAIARGGL